MRQFKANMARDAMVKIMYSRLFDFLIGRINWAIAETPGAGWNHIGLLDVYGFEFYNHNSFEQLCVNFANEKLQNFFLQTVFVSGCWHGHHCSSARPLLTLDLIWGCPLLSPSGRHLHARGWVDFASPLGCANSQEDEKNDYKVEGVEFPHMRVPNNSNIIHLVEGKPNGIFRLLDSASKVHWPPWDLSDLVALLRLSCHLWAAGRAL